jgi:hypothetical protein
MVKRGRKPSTPAQPVRQPEVHYAEARFAGAGKLQADPHRIVAVDLDGPPPAEARNWLKEAAERLIATDNPERVTDAARLLEKEMHEAFLRRWVDEAWGAMGIKNFLTRENFWPRTRRPKR